ncbi:MAG: single-stranded DNA-binding protein [Calditrichaeota bacterium]|nr:single-stranded DNA-binding protein [Calditrichota bacterium]
MAKLKMPEINTVIISGNLTREPVLRNTSSGTPVANFYIASNRKFKDKSGAWKEDVCYVGVVAWHQLADSVNEHLQKGSAVVVEGELQSRNWETDEGSYKSVVEIKAHKIQFLNSKTDHSDDDSSSEDESIEGSETSE